METVQSIKQMIAEAIIDKDAICNSRKYHEMSENEQNELFFILSKIVSLEWVLSEETSLEKTFKDWANAKKKNYEDKRALTY